MTKIKYYFKKFINNPWHSIKVFFRILKRYWMPVYELPSRIIFGNTIGYTINISSRVRHFQRPRTFQNEFLKNKVPDEVLNDAEQLKKQGILIYQTSDERRDSLGFLSNQLKLIYEDERQHITIENRWKQMIRDPIASIPEYKKIFPMDAVDVIRRYYQCDFNIMSLQIWRNFGLEIQEEKKYTKDVISNTLHHDRTPLFGLRIFVLLQDVEKVNGPFRYLSKKLSKKNIRSLKFWHREINTQKNIKELNDQTKPFEGSIGDYAIVNTQECLHGATIPTAGHSRDMAQFYIEPDYKSTKLKNFNELMKIGEDWEMVKLKKHEEDGREV
ncbi:hypothetical protein OAP06_04490 [Gammaproteobacteria bacterium]|nr:hypothetical protein [Gammaproteobacteria bacterium]